MEVREEEEEEEEAPVPVVKKAAKAAAAAKKKMAEEEEEEEEEEEGEALDPLQPVIRKRARKAKPKARRGFTEAEFDALDD